MKKIPIKTQKDIAIMREGGRILAKIMQELKEKVAVGITTKELNRASEALILKYKAEPAFKGYVSKEGEEPFPSSLCASVNDVIVHSSPSDYKLKQGDILKLDLGIQFRGFYADMAITIGVGEIDTEARRLIRATKKALKLGIKKAREGNTFGDIGETIQRHVEYQGFSVVRQLCGHGIGREIHQEPQIPNYGKRHKGPKIQRGMVFCIEPMTTMGHWQLEKANDGFGYKSKDGSLTAHFEHTVAITSKGAKVLTAA